MNKYTKKINERHTDIKQTMSVRRQHKLARIYHVPRTWEMGGEIVSEMSQWGDRYNKNGEKKGWEMEKKIQKKNDWLLCSDDSFSGAGAQFLPHDCVEPGNPLQKFLF